MLILLWKVILMNLTTSSVLSVVTILSVVTVLLVVTVLSVTTDRTNTRYNW